MLELESLEDRCLLSGGALTPSFGTAGKVLTASAGAGNASVLQPDGKIIVAGSLSGDFSLARYNTNGSLDASFGTGGKVTTDFGSTNDQAFGVTLQSDGKIVAVGFAVVGANSTPDYAVARYNTNGSLDATFGTGGKVTTDFNGGADQAASAALQADGKIVVAGRETVSGSNLTDFGLVRYNANGTLDSAFGTGGKVTTDFGSFDGATRVAILTDGRILAAGGEQFALARYTTSGALDTTFGTGGKVQTAVDGPINGMAIQADGKIVVGGQSANDTTQQFDFALARYLSTGALDASFDGDGIVRTTFTNKTAFLFDVAISLDGRPVAVGTLTTENPSTGDESDFVVARYKANGRLDTSFGTSGSVAIDFGSDLEDGTGILIQSDGDYVATGVSGGDAFALARISSTLPHTQPENPSQAYVEQLYRDLLSREGSTADVAFWTAYLNGNPGGNRFLPADEQARFSRAQLARQFTSSLEFAVDTVNNLYGKLLNRTPDTRGLNSFVSFLQSGGTADQVEAIILGSPEYFVLHGSTNQGFLEAVYIDVLGRQIDSAGLTSWTAALTAGASRTEVASAILNSTESYQEEVTALYNQFLGRDPETAGLNAFVTSLQRGASLEDVLVAIVASNEYFNSL